MAALFGADPYTSFNELVARKAGLKPFSYPFACQWGTLFETIVEAYVEKDCDTKLFGSSVSILPVFSSPLWKKHISSPEGYGVVTVFWSKKTKQWTLLTVNQREIASVCPQKSVMVLFEFKCSFIRRASKVEFIPRHYRPQLWKGLAIAPVAQFGLFVDAMFRCCAFDKLGPNQHFNYSIHPRTVVYTPALAWGVTLLFSQASSDEPPTDFGGGSVACFAQGMEKSVPACFRLFMFFLGKVRCLPALRLSAWNTRPRAGLQLSWRTGLEAF